MNETSLIGANIGNYEIVSRIGSGAMGMVFEGVHPQIGKRVAIKVLAPHLTHVKSITHRFIQEAKTINKIEHPNIIEIYDFGELDDGRYYYSMELLQGETLSELMKNRNISLDEILEIAEEVCDALEAVHEQGIIHRDLKPGNIFLAKKGRKTFVKVLDFGVAKLLEPGAESEYETSAGSVLGTPVYMAPEQAMGKISEINSAADIYSVAVIVYRMLSGHLPVYGKNIGEIISKHITADVVPLTTINPLIPQAVSDAVLKGVAKEPGERYPTAWAFFQALKEVTSGIPGDTIFNLRPPRAARQKAGESDSQSRDYYYSFNNDDEKDPSKQPSSKLPLPPPPPIHSVHDTAVSENGPLVSHPAPIEDQSHPSQFEYSQFPAGSYVETHISSSGQSRGKLPLFIGIGVVAVALAFVIGWFVFSSGGSGSKKKSVVSAANTTDTSAASTTEPVAMKPVPATMAPTIIKAPTVIMAPTPVMTPTPVMKTEVEKVRLSAWSTTEGVKAIVVIDGGAPSKQELPFVKSMVKGATVVIEATRKGYKPTKLTLTVTKDTKQQIKMQPVVIYHRPAMSGMAMSVGDGLL
ncbi:serine/threonine protein kinase [Myxococcota bacterium]|nr:serine/threonine protein kinase [Myxococcota bacterium]MBU1537863.1 serine/threonine protein kinase [Myxococcota bacterium]